MPTNKTRYKGFIILQTEVGLFEVYTKEEFAYGKGYRYPEIECCTINEAKEFIDCY
jgi:hypothetical protein